MTLSINSTDAVQTNHGSSVAIKTVQVAKNQQEIEGEMALKLIASANIDSAILPSTASSGQNINIKV